MKMKTLVTANIAPRALNRMRNDLELEVEYTPISERDGRMGEREFREQLADTSVLIVGYEGVSAEIIEEASDLRIIACPRGGPDANVDIEAATKRGIPVLYAPGRNAESVADFTWGLIISAMRHIAQSHHLLRTGMYTGTPKADAAGGGNREDVTWGLGRDSPYEQLKGTEVGGKTIGIVGFGAVGKEVAKRAVGFKPDLLGFDPYVDAQKMADYNAEKVELKPLLRRSDVVTVHVPVTESTRGLIGAAEFALMRESAYFVNTARAAVIDQKALVNQLQSGSIAGAALDVYEEEPIPDDHPLLNLDNVVTTPHLGGATEEVIGRHSRMLVDDIEAVLNGDRPEHVANEDALSTSP